MHSLGASLVGWWNTEEEVAGLAAAIVDLANRGLARVVDPGPGVAERWPAGYRCALAVTIDVDGRYGETNFPARRHVLDLADGL